MSDSMLVFIRGDKLPKVNELRKEVRKLGLELEEWDEDLLDIEGFWPGVYKNEEAGFEFFAGENDSEDLEDWGISHDELDGRTHTVELAFRTELDVIASAICIVAFCSLSDGLAFDDDEELSVNSETCLEWAKQQGVEL